MKDILISAEQLTAFTETALGFMGLQPESARQATQTLIYADMAGLDTHGILNLLSVYIEGLTTGDIDPVATMTTLSDHGAIALLNANRMPGLNAGQQAMMLAIEKAKQFGVGVVCVRNSTHFGAAGYYSSLAIKENMIGMAMTNLGAEPVGHVMGSQHPVIGTNPIALAAPVTGLPDFVLDMSTTVCASGKFKQARARQEKIPADWLCNERGEGVTNPEAYYDRQAFLPGLGGWDKASGGHKGFGLNLMVEILSGVLSGADVPPTGRQGLYNETGHFFLALNIAAFRPVTDFSQHMAQMLNGYLAEPVFDRFDPLQYPGYPDAVIRQQRQQEGIPVPFSLYQQLNQWAQAHHLPCLEALP